MRYGRMKKRFLSIALTAVMVVGLFPAGIAHAQGHTHTEDCYAKVGALLCTIPESTGHAHDESCYEMQKQLTCELEENDEHTHDESCYEMQQILTCTQEECEGHAHSDACYAKGGELICGQEETNSDSENQEYEYIKDLLTYDESIAFNPDTQTFLVIDVDAVQSEHLASLHIYQAEERIKEHELTFDVSINGTPVDNGQTYYLVSQEDHSVETTTISDSFKMTANSGKVAVFILGKGETYSVSYNIADCYYTGEAWNDENGNTYNGDVFTCRPTSDKTITEYNGTAGDDPATASFSFEWDLSNWLDIEIWMADTIRKQMKSPGWGFPDGATGYVDFLIELRDADGNISRLSKTYFNNYGNDDLYNVMYEDGVVSIPLSFWDDNAEDGSPYGEFDIYIPFGYDYRITLLSYSVDTLGGYAYYYNQDHTPDADDFCVTDKSLTGKGEDGSFLEFTFMPMNKDIRIEKAVEGNEPQNAEYEFQVTELVPSFVRKYNDEGYFDGFKKTDDLYQKLSNYPYELYDAKTGDRIDDGTLKTDAEGCFSMKADQYAIFKTWGLPEDFDKYTGGGFHIKDIYDAFSKDISMESRYIVNEVESPDCTTTITHTHSGVETKVDGKKVEDVYGGDKLLYQNAFTDDPVGGTGSLTIRKEVSGTGTPDKDTEFEFTVTKDGTAAVGQYSVDGGAVQSIPADGKIKLKAGQSALLTGLEPGDYTVTEATPTHDHYKSTSFSVNGGTPENGLSAQVMVTAATSETTGGWAKKNGDLVKDADGYFTYTLTSDQISTDGTITVDCDLLAEYMEAQMRDYQNYAPRSFKVKFVNETGAPIRYQDYEFDTVNWIPVGQTYTPSGSPSMKNTNEGASSNSAGYGWGEVWQKMYSFLTGQTDTAGALDTKGFDDNNVRIALAPLRCINPAVVSYFSSNPGKGMLTGNSSTNSAQTITLRQMNALPELIKQAFTFKNWEGEEISLQADDSRTYADFICAFYGVDSLDKLTVAQKYNVLGTGSKGSPALRYDGQSHITTYYSNLAGTISNWCIPYAALNDGTLDYFKTWGFSDTRVEAGKKLISGGQEFSKEDAVIYAYQPDYYLLESDPDILSMAYEYLYERCIRFSLDSDDRPVSTAIDNSATSDDGVGGIKDYMDRTDAATANVLKAMNNGAEIADGDSLTLDRIKGYIEVPNAWNQFRYYDFGFKLIFKADAKQPAAASVTFTNTYENSDTPTPPTPPTPSDETGSLTVSKVVAGNAGSQTVNFHFTVTLSDTSVNGTYGDMTFVNGVAEFALKHGEQKTASKLPAGTRYTVVETEANQEGYTTTVTGANGTVEKNTMKAAAFVNTKNNGGGSDDDDAYGSLTVSKTVAGNAGDTNQKFTFTVQMDRSISGTYGDMRFDKGVAVITLKHGESSTATRLPAGLHYTVTESGYDGYTVSMTGDTGVIHDGKTAVAAFTNTKDNDVPDQPEPDNPDQPTDPDNPSTPEQPENPNVPSNPDQPTTPDNPTTPDHTPKTGDGSHLTLWFVLMVGSLVGLMSSVVMVRKTRYRGKRIK